MTTRLIQSAFLLLLYLLPQGPTYFCTYLIKSLYLFKTLQENLTRAPQVCESWWLVLVLPKDLVRWAGKSEEVERVAEPEEEGLCEFCYVQMNPCLWIPTGDQSWEQKELHSQMAILWNSHASIAKTLFLLTHRYVCVPYFHWNSVSSGKNSWLAHHCI